MTENKIFVAGKISRKTDRAVLMNGEWYALSQITVLQNGIMVPDWMVKKKSSMAKPIQSESEVKSEPIQSTQSTTQTFTNEFNPDNLIECSIKMERPKAILITVKSTGKDLWFPITQIKRAMNGTEFIGIVPSNWIYNQKIASGELPKPTITPSEKDPEEIESNDDAEEDQEKIDNAIDDIHNNY